MKSILDELFSHGGLPLTVVFIIFMHASVTLVDGQRSTSTELYVGVTVYAVDSSFETILESIAVSSGVPIGFERTNFSRSEETKITISVSNMGIGDVMDQLILKKPDYVWFFDDQVINVLPKNSLARIPDIALDDITLDVRQGGELSRSLTSNTAIIAGFERSRSKILSATKSPDESLNAGYMSIPVRIRPTTDVPIHFRSKSFRGLLNEILRTGHANFWMLSTEKNTPDTIMLKFAG